MDKIKVHWSFWLVCIIALFWNLMGSANFFMQQSPEMLVHFPEEVKAFIVNRPQWATAAFAVAVLVGVLADVFLILKNALAFYLFSVSFIGVVVTNIYTLQANTTSDIWFGSAMSIIVSGFLVGYSRFANNKGWLS